MPPTKEQLREEFEKTDIKLTALAKKYDINLNTMKAWKSREGWEKVATDSKKVATKSEKVATKTEKLQPKKPADELRVDAGANGKGQGRRGAPDGNKNAIGNRGGGAPNGNDNAVKHGFYRRYFPNDEKIQNLLEDIEQFTLLDMLWVSIKTKFAAIIHAQEVMYVRDHDDMTKELKKVKGEILKTNDGDIEVVPNEQEYELQFAWDKYATVLTAQSRAMAELRSLIKDYLAQSDETDIRRKQIELMELQIEKSKAELAKLQGGGEETDKAKKWAAATERMAARRKLREQQVTDHE